MKTMNLWPASIYGKARSSSDIFRFLVASSDFWMTNSSRPLACSLIGINASAEAFDSFWRLIQSTVSGKTARKDIATSSATG